MKAVILSDLHFGSRASRPDLFMPFLRNLPADVMLILNGDTMDNRFYSLPDADGRAIEAICVESSRRKIVWLAGNHDASYRPVNPSSIEFAEHYAVEGRLYVNHGWKFVPLWRLQKFAMDILRFVSGRIARRPFAGVPLARKMPLLYRMFKTRMTARAVRFARKNGYPTIVCGHIHEACDTTLDGIRYLNTGAWTNSAATYVFMDGGSFSLRTLDPADPTLCPR